MDRIVNCLASHVCGRCLACVSLQEAAPPDDIVAAVAEADAENADLPTLNHSDNKVRDPIGTIIGAVTIMHPQHERRGCERVLSPPWLQGPLQALAPSTFDSAYHQLVQERIYRTLAQLAGL